MLRHILEKRLLQPFTDCDMRIGARVGGLGNMPGWWFTIESTTTKHFVNQFKSAIEDALSAKSPVRAIMRARATKQRFPVSQWVEDLEKLQSSALEISHKQAAKEKRPTLESPNTPAILESRGLMGLMQARLAKSSLRPRPAVTQTHAPAGALSSIVEERLLTGPGPGLGSKVGPGTKRKRPPAPLMRKTTSAVPQVTDTEVVTSEEKISEEPMIKHTRPPIADQDTIPIIHHESEGETKKASQKPQRPTFERASTTVAPMKPADRKAVKLLGMQIPAHQVNALQASKKTPPSSGPSSLGSTPLTPLSPLTPFTPITPQSPISPKSPSTRSHTPSSTAPSSTAPSSTRPSSIAMSSLKRSSGKSTAATSVTNISSKPRHSKMIQTPHAVDHFPSLGGHFFPHGSVSLLSADEIKEEKPDNMLQNVMPFFSDPQQEYESNFRQRLKKLSGKNSEGELCIEEYLSRSEKTWFGKLRAAELSKTQGKDPEEQPTTTMVQEVRKKARDDGFGLKEDYKPPTGVKRIMRLKIGDWPVYSFLLAFVSRFLIVISVIANHGTSSGANHSCQFIPNHTPERDYRRVSEQVICHRRNLPRYINYLVAALSAFVNRLLCFNSVHLLRTRIFSHRCFAVWAYLHW